MYDNMYDDEEDDMEACDDMEASDVEGRQIKRRKKKPRKGPKKKPSAAQKRSRKKYERSSKAKKTRSTYKPRKKASSDAPHISPLLQRVIRLASTNDKLKPHLMPLIRQAAIDMGIEED